jgi:hypothetical protein
MNPEVAVVSVTEKGVLFRSATRSQVVANGERANDGHFLLEERAPAGARAGYKLALPGLFYVSKIEAEPGKRTVIHVKRVHIGPEDMPK